MTDQQTIIRRAKMPAEIGISMSTIDRLRNAGDFPAPIRLGAQALGFLRAEIETWLSTRTRAAH
jgi:prophage regulatory protein